MNRGGAFDESSSSSSIQQMMRNVNNMRPPHLPLIPSPSSSTTISSSSSAASASSPSSSSVLFPQCSQISNLQLMSTPWLDNQDFPESWRQLLLGDLVEEDKRCNLRPPFQTKNIENWEQYQVQAYPPSSDNIVDVKKELLYEKGYNTYSSQRCEEIQATRSPWSQILPNSSPRSCITTTSFNSSMLDFSNNNNNSNNHKAAGTKHHHQDPSSQECNSPQTGSPYKKARAQPSTQSTFKVRKEKLGDRITALHQLVSPFGKTDTASVLLEAIGYIRFLQSQVEALSSPYLAAISAKMKQQQQQQQQHHLAQGERSCIFPEDPGQLLNVDNCMKRIGAPDQDGGDQEPKKDLRSRGLCLVPVSFTMHVGSDNGAGYWAPTFGGGFR